VGLRAGLDRCGKSRPTGIRSPDRPARRQSLYRLRYRINKKYILKFNKRLEEKAVPDSSIGITIDCELDGPGVESRCGKDFPHPSRPGPTQPPTQCVAGLFPGGKVAGAWL